MRNLTIKLFVTIADDTDPEEVIEQVYDFLCSDPDDLFPKIVTVDGFDFPVPA